jgi:hypothetical protein
MFNKASNANKSFGSSNNSTNATNSLTSFVTTNAPSITNAMQSANTAVNTVVNDASKSIESTFNSLSEPVNQSFQDAMNSDTSPIVSIPIILSLGLLIILFIIVIIFKDQIVIALEIMWHKIKKFFGYDTHKEHKVPVEIQEDRATAQLVDHTAIERAMPGQKQVFNIAQDSYKYSDAEPLCKAFGAELATYDQVKEAWKKGADWCNYGWVKGQSAIYPTQQSKYDKLQLGPEDQRGSCGVPGINGGYFDNPELRFGVNCYGDKPPENDTDDRALMKEPNLTPETLEYNKKVRDYKAHMTEIPVNPFSEGKW